MAEKPADKAGPEERAAELLARAKAAEEWSSKVSDAELRHCWLKIAEEYRLLAQVSVRALGPAKPDTASR